MIGIDRESFNAIFDPGIRTEAMLYCIATQKAQEYALLAKRPDGASALTVSSPGPDASDLTKIIEREADIAGGLKIFLNKAEGYVVINIGMLKDNIIDRLD